MQTRVQKLSGTDKQVTNQDTGSVATSFPDVVEERLLQHLVM